MKKYELFQKLEMELANSDTRKDATRLNELIAEEFEEIGNSGRVYCKESVIKALVNEEVRSYKLSKFRFKALSDTCVLIKYESELEKEVALRSSIWVKQGSGWQLLHHQATPSVSKAYLDKPMRIS